MGPSGPLWCPVATVLTVCTLRFLPLSFSQHPRRVADPHRASNRNVLPSGKYHPQVRRPHGRDTDTVALRPLP